MKCHWGYKVLGASLGIIGIVHGYTMRQYPDLDFASTVTGVLACWATIAIGYGKL